MDKNLLFCLYSGQAQGPDLRRLPSSDSQFHLLASSLSHLSHPRLNLGPMIMCTACTGCIESERVCVCVLGGGGWNVLEYSFLAILQHTQVPTCPMKKPFCSVDDYEFVFSFNIDFDFK